MADEVTQESVASGEAAAEGTLVTGNRVEITDETVRSYTNSLGDSRFSAFQANVWLTAGIRLAPGTILDRELGTRLVGPARGFALHAKQAFRFRRPLQVNLVYSIDGRVEKVYSKRGVDYIAIVSHCREVGGADGWSVESQYTRAVGFSNRGGERAGDRSVLTLSSWFEGAGARHAVSFPEKGSVIHGAVRVFDQALLNLYSGPGSNFHTDVDEARGWGLAGTTLQGPMATALEVELYRDVFGLRFFEMGEIDVSYIASIPVGSALQAYGVVEEHGGGGVRIRSAVATGAGEVVSVGRVFCAANAA